jgi:hypothetical protein
VEGKTIMKITDYKIVVAERVEDLREDVNASCGEGWEVYGGPMLLQKPLTMMQAMVKKFDPHAGEVWVQAPGVRGRWEKVEQVKS